MARERVDSFTEAKGLYREQRPQSVAYFAPDVRAGAAPVHGATGTNMDGIATDFDALVQAEKELAELYDDLFDQLRAAKGLTGPFGDGASPVTATMRRAFLDRADIEGGVQAALVDYIEELFDVRMAILQTLRTYEGIESDATALLNRQMRQMDRETQS